MKNEITMRRWLKGNEILGGNRPDSLLESERSKPNLIKERRQNVTCGSLKE